jgi:hypothetical protein
MLSVSLDLFPFSLPSNITFDANRQLHGLLGRCLSDGIYRWPNQASQSSIEDLPQHQRVKASSEL